ncbi:MAG TPA: hypothetical protein VE866_17110, partial [Candidatus Binatia bacterium]|nr:hypothetical protein [Candidatus Binatia bacterium]
MFDDTTAPNSESTSTVMTEAEPTTAEHHDSATEQAETHATASASSDEKPGEDFASVLETFT